GLQGLQPRRRRIGLQTGALLSIVQAGTVERLGVQVRQGTHEGAILRVDMTPLGQSQPDGSYGAIPYDQGQRYHGTRTPGSLDAGQVRVAGAVLLPGRQHQDLSLTYGVGYGQRCVGRELTPCL